MTNTNSWSNHKHSLSFDHTAGPPLDLHRLAQFVAVTDHENLTEAADQLHLTQQALSSAMRQLEKSLGVDLFDRRGRRLVLTEAGRRLRQGHPSSLPPSPV